MSTVTSHCPSSKLDCTACGPALAGLLAVLSVGSPPLVKLNSPDMVVPSTHMTTTSAPTITTPTNANDELNTRFGGGGTSVSMSGSDCTGRFTATVSPAFGQASPSDWAGHACGVPAGPSSLIGNREFCDRATPITEASVGPASNAGRRVRAGLGPSGRTPRCGILHT